MITIVSGLPRSGTSLMMQMLAAGGMHPLTDQLRSADQDNPRGYFEWEPIKRLSQQPDLILKAEGMVVKVVSELLTSLPSGPVYRVVFMERPLSEVMESQETMLGRRGNSDASDRDTVARAFHQHLAEVRDWLVSRDDIEVCRIGFRRLLQDPASHSLAVRDFLGISLDIDAMARQVDQQLYRNRG